MSDINVISKMQKIIVDAASSSVSVFNVGPQGPAGPGSYTVSATPPVSPSVNSVWFNSDDGRTYIYYNDGNTTQWVEFGNANIGGSFGTYISYTPTFPGGLTVGNGTFSSAYATVNKLTHYYGTFIFGSTSEVTGATVSISLPTSADSTITGVGFPGFTSSVVNFYDTSGFLSVYGFASINGATQARIYATLASGTYVQLATLSSTIPFTWATGDRIQWNFTYRTA